MKTAREMLIEARTKVTKKVYPCDFYTHLEMIGIPDGFHEYVYIAYHDNGNPAYAYLLLPLVDQITIVWDMRDIPGNFKVCKGKDIIAIVHSFEDALEYLPITKALIKEFTSCRCNKGCQ